MAPMYAHSAPTIASSHARTHVHRHFGDHQTVQAASGKHIHHSPVRTAATMASGTASTASHGLSPRDANSLWHHPMSAVRMSEGRNG
jgi:hypothetical protein